MKAFVLDVDGVMTDGTMHYTADGKVMKVFGPDDHDALNLIKNKLRTVFVTADRIGYDITWRRIHTDMGYGLALVPMDLRAEWIEKEFGLSQTIYMGDGILDPPIFEKVGYSICPADGFYTAVAKANYVTKHTAGHRAVAEAVMHIKERYGL